MRRNLTSDIRRNNDLVTYVTTDVGTGELMYANEGEKDIKASLS